MSDNTPEFELSDEAKAAIETMLVRGVHQILESIINTTQTVGARIDWEVNKVQLKPIDDK